MSSLALNGGAYYSAFRFHMHIAHCSHCLKEVAWICLSDKSERPPPFNAGLDLDNCITGGWRLQPTKKIKIFRPHIWVRFPRTGFLAKMCNILKKVEASCDQPCNFLLTFHLFLPFKQKGHIFAKNPVLGILTHLVRMV